MQINSRRVEALETRSKGILRNVPVDAYMRLSRALRKALPSIPAITQRKQLTQWSHCTVIVVEGRKHEVLLADMCERIDVGTMTEADREVVASLDAADLLTVGQTSQQFVQSTAAILARLETDF